MTFTPNSTRGNKEDGGSAGAEEEVACQQCNMSQVLGEQASYGDGVSCEDGTESCGQNGGEAQNEGDEITPPQRPIERVVNVGRRLGDLKGSVSSERRTALATTNKYYWFLSTGIVSQAAWTFVCDVSSNLRT